MSANTTKIYTVAAKAHETGHGESWDELRISSGGYMGDQPFPPCFTSRKSAENYLAQQEPYKHCVLVELELRP